VAASDPNQPVVTSEHARKLHLCSKGMRRVVVRLYGKEAWRRFILHGGIPVSELEAATHPDIKAAVTLAKEEFNS